MSTEPRQPPRYDENSEAFWQRIGLPERADRCLGDQVVVGDTSIIFNNGDLLVINGD